MNGRIVQISISAGGVPKLPVDCAHIGTLGLAGDKHLYRLHGGPSKALLLMASEVVDTLRDEGFSVYYGALGENLTTQGLDHRTWQSGQRLQVGSAQIQLTEPRAPCRKLNPYGPGIQRRISRNAGESGFYASVVSPGLVRKGDAVTYPYSLIETPFAL